MDTKKLMKSIKEDISKIETSHRAVVISKIAGKYYKEAPKSDDKLLVGDTFKYVSRKSQMVKLNWATDV